MAKAPKTPPGDNALGMIRGYVERIERLAEEKDGLAEDIKQVYGEAKGHGLDVPALRTLVARRKKDKDKQAELEQLVKLYEEALVKAGGG